MLNIGRFCRFGRPFLPAASSNGRRPRWTQFTMVIQVLINCQRGRLRLDPLRHHRPLVLGLQQFGNHLSTTIREFTGIAWVILKKLGLVAFTVS